MSAEKIDFVVTWVDGSDPVWNAVKNQYSDKTADTRASRYRDWDQLKYWFRAVEKYAPWVNRVHFVTFGHLPSWLNTEHEKLHIVRHEDFIPKAYLPVFNSTAIEIHLHRIPDLTENFVYFNDDTYLMQPCEPEYFFKNGKPVDMPSFRPVKPNPAGELYYYHLYNDYSIYRSYFTKKALPKLIFKYVSPRYGRGAMLNLKNILAKNFFLSPRHLPKALQKASFETVWKDYGEKLSKTAESRFRTYANNSPEVFRGYQLMTGNFVPGKVKGVILDTQKVEVAKKKIESGECRLLCLSDESDENTFERDKAAINASFDKVFPEKSSFER